FPYTALVRSDDRERALGPRRPGRGGQRQVGPQPVVAAAVVEGHLDPHGPLAGPQLEPGADLVGHGADPAVEALAGGRPRVAGHDLDPGPERAPLVHVDLDRLGRVDDRVLGWWAP